MSIWVLVPVSVGVLITARGSCFVPRSSKLCLPVGINGTLSHLRKHFRKSSANRGVSRGGPCCYRLATLC